jgi:hypothetical protein
MKSDMVIVDVDAGNRKLLATTKNCLRTPEYLVFAQYGRIGKRPEVNWRKKTITIGKSHADVEWAFDTIAGYIVTLVKFNGLVGISYCAPDDAIPKWNPEKSIQLAFSRMRIRADIKFPTLSVDGRSVYVDEFVAIEFTTMRHFAPQKVVAEIRKIMPIVQIVV